MPLDSPLLGATLRGPSEGMREMGGGHSWSLLSLLRPSATIFGIWKAKHLRVRRRQAPRVEQPTITRN